MCEEVIVFVVIKLERVCCFFVNGIIFLVDLLKGLRVKSLIYFYIVILSSKRLLYGFRVWGGGFKLFLNFSNRYGDCIRN